MWGGIHYGLLQRQLECQAAETFQTGRGQAVDSESVPSDVKDYNCPMSIIPPQT